MLQLFYDFIYLILVFFILITYIHKQRNIYNHVLQRLIMDPIIINENASTGNIPNFESWMFQTDEDIKPLLHSKGSTTSLNSDSNNSWFEPLENILSSASSSSIASPVNELNLSEPLIKDEFFNNNTLNVTVSSSPSLLKMEDDDDQAIKIKPQRKRLTPHQKQAHNKIEKRYRININTKIARLQQIIPWVASEQTAFEVGDSLKNKPITPATTTKLNKSMILEKAVDYILYLQNNERLYEMEVMRLKNELETYKRSSASANDSQNSNNNNSNNNNNNINNTTQ